MQQSENQEAPLQTIRKGVKRWVIHLFSKGYSEIHLYQYEMNEDGIFEYRKKRETGEESSTKLLYQNMQKVLMAKGIFYFKGSKQTGVSYYRFE